MKTLAVAVAMGMVGGSGLAGCGATPVEQPMFGTMGQAATVVPHATAAPIPSKPIEPAAVVFDLEARGLTINGEAFDLPTVADFTRLFGPADRKEEKVYRLHTYDRYGLVTYEAYDGIIHSLALYMNTEDFSFVPTDMYSGTFIVDGKRVDRRTKRASLPPERTAEDFTPSNFNGQGFSLFVGGEGPGLQALTISFPNAKKRAVKGPHPREAACEGGDVDACAQVALAYEMGIPVAKDPKKAFKFGKLACDGGEPLSCITIGNAYRSGAGVKRSEANAAAAFKRACTLGLDLGCELAR